MSEAYQDQLGPSLGGIVGAFIGGIAGSYAGYWIFLDQCRRISGALYDPSQEYASLTLFYVLGGLIVGMLVGCGAGILAGTQTEAFLKRRSDRAASSAAS